MISGYNESYIIVKDMLPMLNLDIRFFMFDFSTI